MNQPLQEEEERDDAVVGKAFVWSASLIVVALAVGGGYYYWTMRQKPIPVEKKTTVEPPQVRERILVIPEMPFTDITATAGIHFQHESGADGEKLLPETMGGGCAFLDYDNDGDQDILFVNSCRWPWDRHPPDVAPVQALYRNDGDCHFTDVTKETGLDVTFYGQGVAIGDYDGDGDVDIFFSAVGPNRLFRNDGGKFTDVTEEMGVAGDKDEWSTSCGFLDYDNDGDLDLFVANYVKWDREFDKSQPFNLIGGGRAYGRPQNFPGTFPYFYRNDGGKFVEVGESIGLHVVNPARREIAVGKSLGVTFVDVDSDGFLDILVANDTVQNFFFHNKRNGTFVEEALLHNIAFDQQGQARGAMGIDTARIRSGRHLAVAIGNFSNEMTAFYVARDNGLDFTDEALATGIGPPSRLDLKFGTLFVDVDLDGRMDVIGTNGHLENEINKVQKNQQHAQPPHFFWNCGPESKTEFAEVTNAKCGEDFKRRMVGRGSAVADIDGDGDLDLLFAAVGFAPRLLRNDQSLGHHWLRVSVSGPKSNASSIGALVELELPNETVVGQVMPTRSYLSQSELPVTFGLGTVDAITRVTVTWPDGKKQVVEAPEVDRVLHVRREN